MRRSIITVAVAVLLLAPAAAGGVLMAQTVNLPPPEKREGLSVEEAMNRRRSVRSFADAPLERAEVGQLLWAGGGESVDGTSGPTRTAPSAGGLYPTRFFAVIGAGGELEPGVYAYEWRRHRLRKTKDGDIRSELQRVALRQSAVGDAPCVIVIAADYADTRARYGNRGVERYVHMDAGHAAQNIWLQAESLELSSVTIGAFDDAGVKRVLGIESEPLYLIPVGRSR